MASIMKRGNTYSVRYNYKDHAGKPCKGWETFKTKAEAQERKISVEKELLDGTFLVPDTMTVEEMLYKWIPIQSSKHKWSPKTYTQSVAMVQNLIVPYIGKRKVQDLRTYDIEQFYAGCIFSNDRGLRIEMRENPAIFEALDRLEVESGYTMSMSGKRIRDRIK